MPVSWPHGLARRGPIPLASDTSFVLRWCRTESSADEGTTEGVDACDLDGGTSRGHLWQERMPAADILDSDNCREPDTGADLVRGPFSRGHRASFPPEANLVPALEGMPIRGRPLTELVSVAPRG